MGDRDTDLDLDEERLLRDFDRLLFLLLLFELRSRLRSRLRLLSRFLAPPFRDLDLDVDLCLLLDDDEVRFLSLLLDRVLLLRSEEFDEVVLRRRLRLQETK